MSVWMHILGIVRYDSMALNCYPGPNNKEQIVINELVELKNIYNNNLPHGSEGPIELNFVITDRGPTIVITGDLRDFEDNQKILDWLNNSANELIEKTEEQELFLWLRDASISCTVEGFETVIFGHNITDNIDSKKQFVLKTTIKNQEWEEKTMKEQSLDDLFETLAEFKSKNNPIKKEGKNV